MTGLQPFGVPCTILQYLHPAKFGEKADAGYFLGYVPGSPNVRAYNCRTKIVDVYYNVEICSFTPHKHTGLDWQFDYEGVFRPFSSKSDALGPSEESVLRERLDDFGHLPHQDLYPNGNEDGETPHDSDGPLSDKGDKENMNGQL